jgi:hypothetical protein
MELFFKTESFRSRIGKVFCEVHADSKKGCIHVLDVNAPASTSVTNGIDDIREQIMEQHGLPGSVKDWTWILYSTDGVATIFNGQFAPAPNHLLYPPFQQRAKNYED